MIEQVKDNFTQIPNQIIDDIRISDRAKAVYVKMRRCGPKWSFSVRSLAADLGKNQGTVARALKELEESGYIERFQTRGVGSRFSKMEYRVLNSPHTDPPNAAIPQANRRGDIEYYSDNTISNNTISKTDYLTGDLSSFEEFFHRPLMPSEKAIWERWKRDKVDSRFIETAIKDNEYRRERLTLEHVDESLKEWDAKGLKTLVDINNYILEAKYQNTQYKIRTDSHADTDEANSAVERCKTGNLKQWRDALISMYSENPKDFEYYASRCQTEVFKYLPEAVLKALIVLYEEKNDSELLSAAKEMMEYLWKE